MSRQVTIFQVDAFTQTLFAGNPAGVVLGAEVLTDAEMQLGPTGWLATFKDPFVEWHAPTPDEDPAQPTDTLLRD